MSLLYYIPGQQDSRPEAIAEAGLSHVIGPDSPLFARLGTQRGPDGGSGLLVRPGSSDTIGLDRQAESCEWQKAPGDRRWWIGVAGETRPAELARKERIAGHEVELGDGRRWLVPVARTFGVGSRLPQQLVLGPDGETWEGRPLERFAAVSAKAERVERAIGGTLREDEEPFVLMAEGAAIAADALALNYRVGPAEVSALGLLVVAHYDPADPKTWPPVLRVLWAFIDGPTLEAVDAEEEEAARARRPLDTPDGSSSSPGAEA